MNNDAISSAMDNLSKILGYTAPEAAAAVDQQEDKYRKAAERLLQHIEATGFEYSLTDEEADELYDSFRTKFSPEALMAIPDDQLLQEMFYTVDNTNNSMCYWLEFHQQIREHCGSIAGGSSYKFGLFQKQETGAWISGSPRKQDILDSDQALIKGKEIREILIRGANTIQEAGDISTITDYENLQTALENTIGKYASMTWVHKYFHMLFPALFPIWHSPDGQEHFLFAFGIEPSDKWYVRSGQLATIAKLCNLSSIVFGHAIFDLFGDVKQFVRLGTSNDSTKFADDWRSQGIIALGWQSVGTLTHYRQGDSVNHTALQSALQNAYYPNDARTASKKAREMATFFLSSKNTVFVAMDGERLIAFCDDIGKYYFDDTAEFAHCKPAVWKTVFEQTERLPSKSEGLRTTCVAFKEKANLLYLYEKYYNGTEITVSEDVEDEQHMAEHTPRVNPLFPLNQIIYGAPGTGKTYSSVEYAVAIVENTALVLSKTKDERKAVMSKYQSYIDQGRIVFTTFHQNYGYEEFIQGIRPQPSGDKIGFRIADGVFKKLADTALQNPDKNYVIIIDEINRGNISKIFGELITLLESDKRWGEINQMSATLPLGNTFTIPNNVYVIGTMNTADKSISLIDVALRRRFDFIGMYPDTALITNITLKSVVNALNKHLRSELHGTDLLIGHSFFIDKTEDDLADIMNKNIIPLLYEYFFDEEPKIKKALECLAGTGFEIDKGFEGRIRIKRSSDD